MWGFPQRQAEHDGASRVHFVAIGDDMESMLSPDMEAGRRW